MNQTYTDEQIRENRRLWVEALKSGTFPQGKYFLRDPQNNNYCCLGVACEVLAVPIPKEGGNDIDNDRAYRVMARKLGLNYEQTRQFTEFNDEDSLPFSKIAEVVQETPIKRFKKW